MHFIYHIMRLCVLLHQSHAFKDGDGFSMERTGCGHQTKWVLWSTSPSIYIILLWSGAPVDRAGRTILRQPWQRANVPNANRRGHVVPRWVWPNSCSKKTLTEICTNQECWWSEQQFFFLETGGIRGWSQLKYIKQNQQDKYRGTEKRAE